jgi:hypothetical protein
VPQGKKIPEAKLESAASKGGKVGQRARFAETLKGLGHDGKREPHRPPPKGVKKKKMIGGPPPAPGGPPLGAMPPPPMAGQMGPGAPMGYDGEPDKMKMTMDEFKGGTLHSGSKTGKKVTNRKQAIAIGLSQARKAGQEP